MQTEAIERDHATDQLSHPRLRLAKGTRELEPLLAAIPDAVFRIAANGTIEDVNALGEALVGFTRAELIGRSIELAIVNLELLPVVEATSFTPGSAGACAAHRRGYLTPVEVLVTPHASGSKLAIVRPLYPDQRDGLRDDDVAQIVHDLKGPLATMSLETELLVLDRAESAVSRAVGRIALNVAFLDRMVNDLLDVCAIDTHKFAIQRSRTEMRDLIDHVIERVVASRDRHRIFVDAPDRVTLELDDLRIERVLANLVQNAFKYAPSSTGVVVRLDVGPTTVRVSVSDSGPGIAAADAATIFDKYRRLGDLRGHEGSGLGLFVSKRIVEAHGGRIGVDSAPGAGSQFYFEIPIR
ncbi:MAG: PAS domain-containing sensor histidine kinase [Kofleriaceae bacterium]